MSSTSEEQTSINLAKLDDEECKLLDGNIEEIVQYLLHSTQNYCNKISPSIHTIPSRIRELKEGVFFPRQVSIGPIHRENVNLQVFEGQKAIFLHDLLVHSGPPPKQTLETCVQKVNASIDRIKECYGDGLNSYSDDEITRMMLMDGCFILEFIYKLFMNTFDKEMAIEPLSMVFDLVLIENQIPFFVLQDIFECTSSRFKPITSLHELIICGLVPALGFYDLKFKIKMNGAFYATNHNHILGFIHKCCGPLFDSYEYVEINQPSDSQTFLSAVELDRVNLKPHDQPPQWPMEIQLELPLLWRCRPLAKPTLRIPVLHIHKNTELVFRNMIAYEQLSPPSVCQYVTSYAIVMNQLIDNHEDAATLVESDVLINTLGSNEEVAKLITDMGKGVLCSRFIFLREWKKLHWYHNLFLHKIFALNSRTYFDNPWNVVSFFAGSFLFLFTVVQTYYTVNPV